MTLTKSGFAAALAVCLVAAPAGADPQHTQPAASAAQPPAPAAPPAPSAFDPAKSDEKAVALAEKAIAAMGGDAWSRTRYLKFTWVWKQGDKRTAITHYWDRFGQRSRMEGPSRDGRAVVAVVDHRTKEGVATIEGQVPSDEDVRKYVTLAYERLINDSYWFFMQFKLKDPGARLRYEGEIKAGPVTYDKVLLTFDDGVGLTSKDRYWLYINRDKQLIERWSYVLQAMPSSASPVAWEWVDWQEIGGLRIAMRRTQPGGESEIFIEGLQIFDGLPESVFTSAAAVGQAETVPAS